MSGNKSTFGTDFAKVDAHVIQPEEYDDIPELKDELLEQADFYIGGKLIKRGRPKLAAPKETISIRLDRDLLDHLRGTGAGWQSRVNDLLRKSMKLPDKV
jgi:uncharacterized protein (DUF4415 family)